MRLALDIFKEKLEELISNSRLVLCESFMMNLFSKFLRELPPMQAYWDHIFERDHIQLIYRHTSSTVVRLVEVKNKAFTLANRTN